VQRIVTFVVLILAGAGCFAIALFTLPMIVLRPAKFALSYTVGSLLILTRSVSLPPRHGHGRISELGSQLDAT